MSESTTTAGVEWPDEPVLKLDRIQGIAVPGFFKPRQTLVLLRYQRNADACAAVRRFLAQLLPELSTAAETLADRRRFRKERVAGERALMAVAFTYPGLLGLTPSAQDFRSPAFKLGMVERSALLGDPTSKEQDGHPSKWKVGAPGNEPDLMLVVAGDGPEQVGRRVDQILARVAEAGMQHECLEGGRRERATQGHEHFGFADGISQPGIRGRDCEGKFVTDRHVPAHRWPAAALYGYPGQDLVWPGEFVMGYPKSGPDPLKPGPVVEAQPDWSCDGSFLVFRRLVQNVPLFWQTMRREAERLSAFPGFEKIDDEALAARLVGRWRSGAPFSRLQVPGGEVEHKLATVASENNHFRFDVDTPDLVAGESALPSAHADPLGQTCPLAAHIRKVNPRDSATDMGGTGARYERRILRVGAAFGPTIADPKAEPPTIEPPNGESPKGEERGLLFLSIQSSIEDQFEFLQARWMNDDCRPRAPSGVDMIAGRNPAAAPQCAIFGEDGQMARVRAPGPFVTTTGGAYFFVPSIPAIRDVLAVDPDLSTAP